MALGTLARHNIGASDTDESLFLFTEASTADLSVVNRSGDPAAIRVAVVDGAVGDLAPEDYVYFDFEVPANESRPLFVREAFSAGDRIVVRSDNTDVTFRLSGEGA